MLKITVSNLEKARQNSLEFAQSINAKLQEHYAPHSKFKDLKENIYDFHHSNNESLSIMNFEQEFNNHFADNPKNKKELDQLKNFFHLYVAQFKKKNLKVINTKMRINFMVSENFKLGGEIPIVSIYRNTKYYAYFIIQKDCDWEKELRFPVIQYYLASEVFNVNSSMVSVGVFSQESEAFYEKCYNKAGLDAAMKELKLLGNRIHKNLL